MPGLEITVYYFSDCSIRGSVDPGLGVEVAWDSPLLEGYDSIFISRQTDISKISSLRLPAARELLRRRNIDAVLIQGYMHPFERQVVRAATGLGLRVVMRGEFSDLRRRGIVKRIARRAYLRWFYSHVDAFCYIGKDAREHLETFGIPESRLFFSPYSVDEALFRSQRQQFSREESRTRLGLGRDHFCLLFCGKLIPRKAPLLLLDALEKLAQRERIALIVVGDGPLRDEVIRRGKAILGSRFLFAGFVNQSQLGRFYVAADTFVLPSNHETWGLVVNEAMQFSLPVVVSDHVGCHRDLVGDHDTGFIFSSDDSLSLANSLSKLVTSPATARQQGRNARNRIRSYSPTESARGVWKAASGT